MTEYISSAYALDQWAETRANMSRHVRVHVAVVNVGERPLGQWAESRCRLAVAHDQPCVRYSRVACRRVMCECIRCSRVAVTFLSSRGAGAVVAPVALFVSRPSVYCRTAVRVKLQTVNAYVSGRRLTQTCRCKCGILTRPTSTCSRRRLDIAFSDL